MPADILFNLVNLAVLPAWAALAALAPFQRDLALSTARWTAALVAGFYAALLVTALTAGGPLPEGAGFSSLDGIVALFGSREAVLAGWAHYLAFDLWVGAWIAEDADKAGVPHLLVLPCVGLTFLAGPVGLLLYLLVRALRRRRSRRR